MKKKTFIKEGAYQKIDNTKSNKIKGALDLNKEVLDTLVDKNVLGTTDCCQYFLKPLLIDIPNYDDPPEEVTNSIPTFGIFVTTNGVEFAVWIKTPDGGVLPFSISS